MTYTFAAFEMQYGVLQVGINAKPDERSHELVLRR